MEERKKRKKKERKNTLCGAEDTNNALTLSSIRCQSVTWCFCTVLYLVALVTMAYELPFVPCLTLQYHMFC